MECEAKAFFVINLGVVGWIAFLVRERERERKKKFICIAYMLRHVVIKRNKGKARAFF
jgi:diacylglycerol kinase family enzyme